jgi:hypothetical protein
VPGGPDDPGYERELRKVREPGEFWYEQTTPSDLLPGRCKDVIGNPEEYSQEPGNRKQDRHFVRVEGSYTSDPCKTKHQGPHPDGEKDSPKPPADLSNLKAEAGKVSLPDESCNDRRGCRASHRGRYREGEDTGVFGDQRGLGDNVPEY